MTRNGGRFLRPSIDVDGVIAAFAQEFTAVVLKMSNQITPLHSCVPNYVTISA